MSGYKVGSVAGLITETGDVKQDLVDLFSVKVKPNQQVVAKKEVQAEANKTPVQKKAKKNKIKAEKEPKAEITEPTPTTAVNDQPEKPKKKARRAKKKSKGNAQPAPAVIAENTAGVAANVVQAASEPAENPQKKNRKRKARSTPGGFGIEVLPSKPKLNKLTDDGGEVSIDDLPSPTASDSESDEEDQEKNKKRPRKAKKNKKSNEDKPEDDNKPEDVSSTVFVKNVPIKCKQKQLLKFFTRYGKVDKAWIRCVPVDETTTSKKVAAIKQQFHPSRTSLSACVRFSNFQEAAAAVADSGVEYESHHLSISWARAMQKDKAAPATPAKQQHDTKKAVFVGALAFALEDEALWTHFKECGRVVDVRIIRDSQSGMGKGFGYVNFETEDAVELALKLNGSQLGERRIRVKRAVAQPGKNQGLGNGVHSGQDSGKKSGKKGKRNKQDQDAPADGSAPQKIASFAGETATENGTKKVKKLGAGEKKKRIIAKKLGGA